MTLRASDPSIRFHVSPELCGVCVAHQRELHKVRTAPGTAPGATRSTPKPRPGPSGISGSKALPRGQFTRLSDPVQ